MNITRRAVDVFKLPDRLTAPVMFAVLACVGGHPQWFGGVFKHFATAFTDSPADA